jgi:hypothetical protein
VKGWAGWAEGACGNGSVDRRSSWHVIGVVCRVASANWGGEDSGDRAVGLGEADWHWRLDGAAVVQQGGRGLRRREEGEDDGTYA